MTTTLLAGRVTLGDQAYTGSWYFIAGVDNIDEFIAGYQEIFDDQGVGTPVRWYRTTGALVNLAAQEIKGVFIDERDQFRDDLTCLLFPLDGLNVGRLAMVKVGMQDRWFDDVVDNMRAGLP